MEPASTPNATEESTTAGIIRTVLSGLPRIAVADMPAGTVAIPRRTVLEAGLDLQQVRQWLWTTRGFESETYIRGPQPGDPLQPEPFFAVPLAAFSPRA